jgi:hypothetical protein
MIKYYSYNCSYLFEYFIEGSEFLLDFLHEILMLLDFATCCLQVSAQLLRELAIRRLPLCKWVQHVQHDLADFCLEFEKCHLVHHGRRV